MVPFPWVQVSKRTTRRGPHATSASQPALESCQHQGPLMSAHVTKADKPEMPANDLVIRCISLQEERWKEEPLMSHPRESDNSGLFTETRGRVYRVHIPELSQRCRNHHPPGPRPPVTHSWAACTLPSQQPSICNSGIMYHFLLTVLLPQRTPAWGTSPAPGASSWRTSRV